MSNETWYCRKCGSRDIFHDATVAWDPDEETWSVVGVQDGMWCETCMGRDAADKGDPDFGVPPEYTVVVYCPHTDQVYLQRPLDEDEVMDEMQFADEAGQELGLEVDHSYDRYLPSCSGDIRVEFRSDPDNPGLIYSGRSFYFKREDSMRRTVVVLPNKDTYIEEIHNNGEVYWDGPYSEPVATELAGIGARKQHIRSSDMHLDSIQEARWAKEEG